MSYLMKLYETYENCAGEIGKTHKTEDGKEKLPLLPVCHTTNNAHIEIIISIEGEFLRAAAVSKQDAVTVIPCTEESSNRTSGICPHPLFDKLQYVAGDYHTYTDTKDAEAHEQYIVKLGQWVLSAFSNPKLTAVYTYLKKGAVIGDLVRHGILFADNNNRLLKSWNNDLGEKPPVFQVVVGSQADAFVRFAVDEAGFSTYELWKDREIQDSFINYSYSKTKEHDLCMVTGRQTAYAAMHPKKIRHSGDSAKIISANDKENFTFLGRFSESRQAASVSSDVSQKAHSALRWLIDRQGFKNGSGPQTFVAWTTNDKKLPDISEDSFGFGDFQEEETPVDTAEGFARRMNKTLAGYRKDLVGSDEVIILGLDSATTGRLSVIYYKHMNGSEFLDRVEHWHNTCTWKHSYRFEKKSKARIIFCGAPSPNDIAFAALGNADEKVKSGVRERILRCIIDGMALPSDIVRLAVTRASNPLAMEDWEWRKTLSIACALYSKLHEERNYTMSLDTKRATRDYLYGRLLAVADLLEGEALKLAEENRETNAMRYMSAFSTQPFKIWNIIYNAIVPYRSKLKEGKLIFYEKILTEICSLFDSEDYVSNQPLSGEYLLGFYCQKDAVFNKKQPQDTEENINDGRDNDVNE